MCTFTHQEEQRGCIHLIMYTCSSAAILLLPLSPHRPSSSNELLEVPSSSSLSSSSKMAALANIVSKEKEAVPVKSTTLPSGEHTVDKLAQHDPDFVDDPDVPPLI